MYNGTISLSDSSESGGGLNCFAPAVSAPSGVGLLRLGRGGDAFCGGVISEQGDGEDDSSCNNGGGDSLPSDCGLSSRGGGMSSTGDGLSCRCGDCGGEISSCKDGNRLGGD